MDIFEDITLQAVLSVHVGGATAVNSKNNIDIPYNYIYSYYCLYSRYLWVVGAQLFAGISY